MTAIIFDCDDTILATAKSRWSVRIATAARFGVHLDELTIRASWGKPFDELIRSVVPTLDGRGAPCARQFADTYGYDLGACEGYQTLLAMRDLVQLTGPIRRAEAAPQYRQALRQRLDSLRATWTAL
jgi:beta-phosphoglucomutase-like phosphatase (HAD superfamily)